MLRTGLSTLRHGRAWPGHPRLPVPPPSKVVGDRAKPGHDEWANPCHPTAYPDAYGAKAGHDDRANPPHRRPCPDAYGAKAGHDDGIEFAYFWASSDRVMRPPQGDDASVQGQRAKFPEDRTRRSVP